jgi:hypothetical protein
MRNSTTGDTHSETRPFDFAFRYEFKNKPSESADSFELLIEVAPDGSGEIHFQDQGDFLNDEFAAIFTPEDDALEHLYRMMLASGLLEPMWQPPRVIRREDDGQVRLSITSGGNFCELIAYQSHPSSQYLQPIFDAIRALVPQTIWEKINQPFKGN